MTAKEKAKKMVKNSPQEWAKKHGQTPGRQLVGTITGKKFGLRKS